MMRDRGVFGGSQHAFSLGSEVWARTGATQCRPQVTPTNDLWRVDETYIKVKGEDKYLYRAVDFFCSGLFVCRGSSDEVEG